MTGKGLSRVLGSLFGSDRRESPDGVADADVLTRDHGLTGFVFVVGIKEFYDALGGRTGRLAEAVRLICDTVLAEYTGPGDIAGYADDDHLVLRFADMESPAARRRTATIVEHIGTKLLGEHFVQSGRFKAVIALVEAEQFLDDGRPDPVKVGDIVAFARTQPADAPVDDSPEWRPFRFVTLHDRRWQAVRGSMASDPSLQWEVLRSDARKPDPISQWEALRHESTKREVRWEEIRREPRSPRPVATVDSPAVPKRRSEGGA